MIASPKGCSEPFSALAAIDNNSSLWNTERFGVVIKSPEAILEIPEEERTVFVGNMYYMQVGTQLDSMGIKYKYYNDHYDI